MHLDERGRHIGVWSVNHGSTLKRGIDFHCVRGRLKFIFPEYVGDSATKHREHRFGENPVGKYEVGTFDDVGVGVKSLIHVHIF